MSLSLAIATFAAGGHPWSVTFGFTLWGAKAASLMGFDFSAAPFWQWAGPKRALADSVLSDTSSLTDLGMILGAMAVELLADGLGKLSRSRTPRASRVRWPRP